MCRLCLCAGWIISCFCFGLCSVTGVTGNARNYRALFENIIFWYRQSRNKEYPTMLVESSPLLLSCFDFVSDKELLLLIENRDLSMDE